MANVTARKRGEKWEYRFELAPIDGKRKQISKSGFKTKKEALEAGAKAFTQYNQAGIHFTPSEVSVADYLNYWYDQSCEPNLKYNTKIGYLGIINNHLIPNFGTYRLKAITPSVLQDYANKLKMNGYSKSHIVGILSTFSAAMDYAVNPLQYISSNPMRYVKMPKIEREPRQRVILEYDEWERIIERFPFGSRFYIPLMIGYFTGARISEAFALTWDDVDFENATITINKQMVKRNQGADVRSAVITGGKKCQVSQWFFQSVKTVSSNRTIKIGDTLLNALKKERARQKQNELKYGEYYTFYYQKPMIDEKNNEIMQIVPIPKGIPVALKPASMICVDENGKYTSTDSFKYCARVIHRELKLAFDYHSLRHTHATILIENGAPIKAVQTRLGHNNIQTTLQTYVHDTEKMQDDAVNVFEQSFKRNA